MPSRLAATIEKQHYLRDVEIFQDLMVEERAALTHRAPMQHVAAGTIFYSPEETNELLFILNEGRVRLYHVSADGNALTTAMLDAGTIFGEMGLLGQELYGAYAQAMTPCSLCVLSREDVKSLLFGNPRIAYRISESLGRRLVQAEKRISDFAHKSVSERVAALLVDRARDRRVWPVRASQPEVRCTHEELARLAGTYRETVTKVLSAFRSQGLIELQRGRIIVLDLGMLEAVSVGARHTRCHS